MSRPLYRRDRAADALVEMQEPEGDVDGRALFAYCMDRTWTLLLAADEGYTGDEIASLTLDGFDVQERG